MTEKTAPPERTEVVRLRCTQAEKLAWEERAKREGRTLSDLVRESLGQKLDTKPKTRARRADPRLVAEVARIGNNANQVAFPHYNAGGLCGFEQKNPDRFSAGGEKAAWITTNIKHASMVVVTESPVDAMSLDQLLQEDGTDTRHIAYVSTGGTISHKQAGTLRQVLERAQERGAAVKLATDGDLAGDKLAEQLQGLAPQPAERIRPPEGQDWNDHLQARQHEQAQQAAQRSSSGPRMG